MDELLKAIEELNRVYKASGVSSVRVELDGRIRIEIDGIAKGLPYKNTNGEWLRGLSDEELVGMLDYEIVLGKSCEDIQCNDCEGCQNRVLAWLRAEHKEQ